MTQSKLAEGIIKAVSGQIAQVEVLNSTFPEPFELLTTESNPPHILEVVKQDENIVYCVVLSDSSSLFRGMKIKGLGLKSFRTTHNRRAF